jgi:hypothetical protein
MMGDAVVATLTKGCASTLLMCAAWQNVTGDWVSRLGLGVARLPPTRVNHDGGARLGKSDLGDLDRAPRTAVSSKNVLVYALMGQPVHARQHGRVTGGPWSVCTLRNIAIAIATLQRSPKRVAPCVVMAAHARGAGGLGQQACGPPVAQPEVPADRAPLPVQQQWAARTIKPPYTRRTGG